MKIGHAFEVLTEPNTDDPDHPVIAVRHTPSGYEMHPTGADIAKWAGRRNGDAYVLAVAGLVVERFHNEHPELATADQAADAPKPPDGEQAQPEPVRITQPIGFEMVDDTHIPAVYATDVQWHTSEGNGDLVRVTFLELNISQGTVRRFPRAVLIMRAEHVAAIAQSLGQAFSRATKGSLPPGAESPQGPGRLH